MLLQGGSSFFEKYKFETRDPIGLGTYSICMACTEVKTHKRYAAKILKSCVNADTEIETLDFCRGQPNIVEFIEVIKDDEYTYIVTELLEGGELYAYVQENLLSETQARNLFADIVKAVTFMHSNRIVHRDLKLENILFAQKHTSNVKIIDFGFAARISSKRLMDTPCYTLEYAAPEILSNQKYSEACDLWSLGVILYTLLCGHTPFQRRNESQDAHEIRERIKRASIDTDSSAWQSLNKSAKDLIRSLLTVLPSKRMKLSNILDSGWFDAPVNSHSSATEIIESSNDRQTFTEEHRSTPTTLVTTATNLAKSHSTSTTNSINLGLSKSSSGIGIASDQFNRSISIDSMASTIRNDLLPEHEYSDEPKEILVSTMLTYTLNDHQQYHMTIDTDTEENIEPEVISSDSESELCVNIDGEYEDLLGYESNMPSLLRTVTHTIDLDKVLLYDNNEIKLPCPGRNIKYEPKMIKPEIKLDLASKPNQYSRKAPKKRKYSNSSDERWFDEPEKKIMKTDTINHRECTVHMPKRFTRSSLRRQEIQ